MKKKILFLTTRLPLPISDGRSFTLNQYILALLEDYEVGLISLNSDSVTNKQDNNLSFVKTMTDTSFFQKICNVFFLSMFKGYPLQVSAVYSKKNQKYFNKIVDDFKPDIIICDMIRMSRYVTKLKFNCKKVLDMDDVLSRRYEQSIENNDDVLGKFRTKLPKVFVKIYDKLQLNKFVLKFEFKRMKKQELKSLDLFDKVCLVSPIEVKKIKSITNKDNVFVWPVTIKQSSYSYNDSFDPKELLFIGNMCVSQNQVTLKYFVDNIYPKISSDFKVKVIGKYNERVLCEFKNYNFVNFVGRVDDLTKSIQNSLCLIAPIQFGSGIKIKVLESMACGGVVITSVIGVEGLNVEPGKDLFVCDDVNEYVDAINKISIDSKLRKTVSANAYKYIEKYHNDNLNKYVISSELGDE